MTHRPAISLPAHRDDHLPFIDQLRGLAILLVFLFHAYLVAYAAATPPAWSNFLPFVAGHPSRWLLFPLANGWVGVPIFFVISGFCIHLSHQRSRDRGWPPFFRRRFFRIYPPYLLALLFFTFVFPVSRLAFAPPHVPRDVVVLATHLTLTHNFVPASIIRINGSFWTIAVEMQLYAIYPLLLTLVRRIGWNRCLIVALGFELALSQFPYLFPQGGWWLDLAAKGPFAFWFSWAIGARIADDWLARRPLFLARLPLGLTFAAFAASCLFSTRDTLAFLFGALAAAHLLARYLSPSATTDAIFSTKLAAHLRFTGLVSYSLYLLHEPFLEALPVWLGSGWSRRPLALLSLGLLEWPLLLLLAWAFHRLVELPSIAWGRKLAAPKTLNSARAISATLL